MNKPKISILLASYRSGDLLKKIFIPSLTNSSVDIEVVVYDNGGNNLEENALDKDFSFLSRNKTNINWNVIGDGENIGLNAALNKCAEAATADYFYLPHTDMYLLPKWDTELLRACKHLPPTSFLFCSRSIEKQSHIPGQYIKDFGTDLSNFDEKGLCDFFETYNEKGLYTYYRMPFFHHRKLYDKMNKFNQKNGFGNGGYWDFLFSYATDNDLFFTAYHVGVRRFFMCYSSVVYHLSGHSNKQQTIDKDDKTPYVMVSEKWKKLGYRVDMNMDRSEQNLIPWGIGG